MILTWLLTLIPYASGDFVYPDFNFTTGLSFVGNSGTTNCKDLVIARYGDVQGVADLFTEDFRMEMMEGPDLFIERTVETNLESTSGSLFNETAGLRHRYDFSAAPTERCPVRARLTPSGPDKVGAVWYNKRVPVLRGFDTIFTFQITDMSRECTLSRDVSFSTIHHQTCATRGGDGFAFVIHNDPNATSAIGDRASGIGYSGLENSIAVEFDTWYNPEPGVDVIFSDHVSVQSSSSGPNTFKITGQLSRPRVHDLADGKIHIARVTYFPQLMLEYMPYFTATEYLLPYIKDKSEGRRVGTLVVYLDDGAISGDVPLVAIPINLSVLLMNLPQDTAYVGFTASTGRAWEKHDILSWYWCDELPCRHPPKFDAESTRPWFEIDESEEWKLIFDYGQGTRLYPQATRLRKFTPGKGYGGGDVDSIPTKHQSPRTDPLTVNHALEHHSDKGRNEGLYEQADLQVPPNTLY